MLITPKLPKMDRQKAVDAERREKECQKARDVHIEHVKSLSAGIQAMSEDMATADILAVHLSEILEKGEPIDMDDMKSIAECLGEIYEIVNDLLDITDGYCPPDEGDD